MNETKRLDERAAQRGAADPGTSGSSRNTAALATARELAHHGARVHPLHDVTTGHCSCRDGAACTKAGKHPRLSDWPQAASADVACIEAWAQQWPSANWGVATGPASGIVVLDADGERGDDHQEPLAPRACIPDTVWHAAGAIVQTGGGGYQLYFAPPKQTRLGNWVRCLPGVDVRGARGQVVLPGSVSGKGPYSWVKPPTTWPLPPLPEAFAQELQRGNARQRQQAQSAVAQGLPVPKGQRDSTLYYTYVKARWDAGVDKETILQDALEANRTLFQPPLEEWVVREKVDRVCGQPRREAPRNTAVHVGTYREPDFSCDEERFSIVGDARRLAENYQDRLRYVPEWGWMGWYDGVWHKDIGNILPAELAEETLRRARAWAFAPERNLSTKQEECWFKHFRAAFNLVQRIVDAARSKRQLVAATTDFDVDPLLLNTPSGVVDLRRGELLPHDPSRMLTKQTAVPYESEALCPRWLQFLREVFPAATPEDQEKVLDWVQRALGYSITGLTREQVWFFATGNGSNGKSVLLETVRAVLGSYAAPIKVDALLEHQGHRGGPDPELAATVGARFVTSQEPNDSHGRRATWDSARLKELTGGDTLQIHGKYERAYPYRPSFKLWVSANGQPELADTSYGTWRRIRVLPFVVRFDEAGTNGHRADPTLAEALKTEGPGILVWLVQGAQAWQDRGLGEVPAVIQEATKAYHEQEDDYAAFFDGVLVHNAASSTPLEQVWQAFVGWRQTGDDAWVEDKRALAKLAVSHGYAKKRGHGGITVLAGCRLTTSDATDGTKGGHGTEGTERSDEADESDGRDGSGRTGGAGEDGEDDSPLCANSSQCTVPLGDFSPQADYASPSSPTSDEHCGILITRHAELVAAVDALLNHADRPVYLDTETTGLDPAADRLVSIQLHQDGGPTYIIDWRQATPAWDGEVQRLLAGVKLVGHHLAFDLAMLMSRVGVERATVAHDTLLAEQVLCGGARSGGYSLATVAARYGRPVDKSCQADFIGVCPGDTCWSVPFTPEQIAYMRQDVEVLPTLLHAQQDRLAQSGQADVAELEHAIVPVMAGLRSSGVLVDLAAWQDIIEQAQQEAEMAAATVRDLLGEPELNLNSPQQVLAALRANGLEDLNKTDERTLEPLRACHTAVDALLRYRAAAKVVSSYGAGFIKRLSPDGRLRGDWQQIGTETGRMACRTPAMQTLPKPFRHAVVAAPGHVLLTADYSTMELRIMAKLASERRLLDGFAAGRDLHADTARYVFQLDPDSDMGAEYRPGMSYRDAGKKLNFSMVYGASAYGIAQQLDIPVQEAERLLERFQHLYPALTCWSEQVREQGLRDGFTATPLGRRRFYRAVDSDDWQDRNRMLREAGNAPVQGCGADITKVAMRLFAARVSPRDAHPVIVLHDELVVECRDEVADQVAAELKRAMYDAGVWAEVPLPEPEVTSARSWTK